MENRLIFAHRLKSLREELSLTQKDFAAKVESTAATISAYENATKNPSLDIVMNIAKCCSVSIDWLCGLSERKTTNCNVETYSDIVNLLFKLDSNSDFDMYIGRFDSMSPELEYDAITIKDEIIKNFLREWDKMRSAFYEGIIDEEMFDLWKEKTLIKYNFRIEKHNDPIIDDDLSHF